MMMGLADDWSQNSKQANSMCVHMCDAPSRVSVCARACLAPRSPNAATEDRRIVVSQLALAAATSAAPHSIQPPRPAQATVNATGNARSRALASFSAAAGAAARAAEGGAAGAVLGAGRGVDVRRGAEELKPRARPQGRWRTGHPRRRCTSPEVLRVEGATRVRGHGEARGGVLGRALARGAQRSGAWSGGAKDNMGQQ